MRHLESNSRQRKPGILCPSPNPKNLFMLRRPLCIEPECGIVQRCLRVGQWHSPKPDVMSLSWTVADRLLEADVLPAIEQVKRTEGRVGVGPIEKEAPHHAPRTFQIEPFGLGPPSCPKSPPELRHGSGQDDVDWIAREAVRGERIARYPTAV